MKHTCSPGVPWPYSIAVSSVSLNHRPSSFSISSMYDNEAPLGIVPAAVAVRDGAARILTPVKSDCAGMLASCALYLYEWLKNKTKQPAQESCSFLRTMFLQSFSHNSNSICMTEVKSIHFTFHPINSWYCRRPFSNKCRILFVLEKYCFFYVLILKILYVRINNSPRLNSTGFLHSYSLRMLALHKSTCTFLCSKELADMDSENN